MSVSGVGPRGLPNLNELTAPNNGSKGSSSSSKPSSGSNDPSGSLNSATASFLATGLQSQQQLRQVLFPFLKDALNEGQGDG